MFGRLTVIATFAAAAAFLSTLAAEAASLVVTESRHSVADTVARLEKALEAKGIKVAGKVDHAAGAKAAGLEMPPTVVVMFGNPKLGTPLMQSNPEIGADLPMKILVWQDKDGRVKIGYGAPAELAARYAIKDRAAVVEAMTGALATFAKAATE